MTSQMFHSVQDLIGLAVHALDDEAGHVDDIYFDDRAWEVRYLVVDTGDWLAGRRVLLSPIAAVDGVRWSEEVLPVCLTRRQIERSPEVDLAAPVSQWELEAIHRHYAWPWYSGETLNGGADGAGHETLAPEDRDEYHLRSAREVLEFDLEARDGHVGEVDDFLFAIADWTIDYIVIDTGTWLSGRKVAVAASWVNDIRPSESTAYLDLKRETIQKSPDYDPAEFLTTAS